MRWKMSIPFGGALVALFSSTSITCGQEPTLIREAVSREISIFVAEGNPTLEAISREWSLHVENGVPDREVISREHDLLVDVPGIPPPVTDIAITTSPTGETATLDWTAYKPWLVGDVARFEVYLSGAGPFTDVSGMTPHATVGGDITVLTLEGLAAFTDHYFAVVAVDGQGNRTTAVEYSAAYILTAEVTSRELSIHVESGRPGGETISRGYDLLVSDPAPPPAIPGSDLTASGSPLNDSVTLDWTNYNQWLSGDVERFDIYFSDAGPIPDVAGLTPYTSAGGDVNSITLSGLAPNIDHYFAVVPVDGQGNQVEIVSHTASYIRTRELVSREHSLHVANGTAGREVISREFSAVIADDTVPDPVTGFGSTFDVVASASAFGAIDLGWPDYNESLQTDVVRYRVYLDSGFFTDVSDMTPAGFLSAERNSATIEGFLGGQILYVAVVAEDALGNFDPIVYARSVQASYAPVFGFGGDSEVVREGEVANILVTLDEAATGVTYQLFPFTAVPFDGTDGDYLDVTVPLDFVYNDYLGRYEARVEIPIIRDQVPEGGESFFLQVLNPGGGVASSLAITITEDPPYRQVVWHPERQDPPIEPALGTNQLGVVLDPAVPGAQWRLVGEPFWRDPGATNLAASLASGQHRIEYKPVSGFDPPLYPENDPADPVDDGPDPRNHVFLGGGQTHLFETTYPSGPSLSGTLTVDLLPAPLALAPLESDRIQWRLVGESTWRDSGAAATLPPGKHLLEFKDTVTGFLAPTPRAARVVDGFTTFLTASWQETPASGNGPAVLPFTAPPGTPQADSAPYHFLGQIETARGYGTGSVVTRGTVLTAGRVVWDPERLSSAEDIAWLGQRHADYGADLADDYIPEVRYPRGYVLLAGYDALRDDEITNGATGREAPGGLPSDQLDLAVLYFSSENGDINPARWGFSGFLADYAPDPATNTWLLGSRDKVLAGYPLGGIPTADRGRLHATAATDLDIPNLDGFLYRSSEFHGTPGLEGAPLLVSHPNGKHYPAAVYLGQNNGAVFRSLDPFAAFAIWLAEARSRSGIVRLNGGGEYMPRWSGDGDIDGFLFVDFQPEDGRWRLIDPTTGEILSDWLEPGLRLSVREGIYSVEYEPVAGFTSPSTQLVATTAGLTSAPLESSYQFTYDDWALQNFTAPELADPEFSGPEVSLNGLPNLLAYACGLSPGQVTRPAADPTTATPGLPRVSVNRAVAPPLFTVEFLIRNPRLTTDLLYLVEFAESPDGPWTGSSEPPFDRTLSLAPLDNSWSHAILQIPVDTSHTAQFARLRVIQGP